MNNKIVVGIGNIYAAEALFSTKLHPNTIAKSITEKQYNILVKNIKKILLQAIKNNGTTFRDYTTSDGKSGNFQNELNVYGRASLPCKICGTTLQEIRLGQRSTVFCPRCQKTSFKQIFDLTATV